MTTRVSKSYEYNGICDICGFKKKSYELRRRWDGFWVCKEDWEQRHILDFYRTKNDVHKLPFTRPDKQDELSWTPVFDNLVETLGTGTITKLATYTVKHNVVNYTINIILTGDATTSHFIPPSFYTLPITPVTEGTCTSIRDSIGRGTNIIVVGGRGSYADNWFTSSSNLVFTGTYGV